MKRKAVAVLAALTLGMGTGLAVAAVGPPGVNGPGLAAVGPVSATNGFPVWYKDRNGVRLEICIDDPLCPAPGVPDPALPLLYPTNYPDESFFTRTEALLPVTGGGDALAEIQLEATFDPANPVDSQTTFARVRYRFDAATGAQYKITSPTTGPLGKIVNEDGSGEVFDTEDIGIGTQGDFSGALGGRIGPWLTWDTFGTATGAPPAGYVGDGTTQHKIKGSPYDTNFFRIEGPGINPTPLVDKCLTVAGAFGDCTETDLFSVQGRLATVAGLTADQVTYSRSTTAGGFLDVFASTEADNQYAINVSGAGFDTTSLTGSPATAGNYFAHVAYTGAKPATVSVNNTTDNPDSIKVANVVDRVTGTANYTPGVAGAAGSLAITAVSSDTATPPVLTASGFAAGSIPLVSGTLTVPALDAPPVSVTVTSAAGGSVKLPVVIGPAVTAPPVANAGPDQTVAAGQLVTLDGSATGVISTYSWMTPGITLSDPTVANPTFTATPGIYIFALTVTGPGGTSTSAVKITVAAPVVPSAPVIGTATAGDTTATVNWTAPANGGSAITGYTVRVADAVTDVQVGALLPAAAGATSLAVTGLVNGTAVRFQVQATNAIGTGAFSALSTAVTPVPPPTKPGSPTGLTGVNATATSIDLSWTAPADNGGAPIIRYVLRLSTDNGVTWATPWLYTPLTNPTGTTLTWAGLTPGTSYQFQVVAANSVGYGPFSATSPAVSTTAATAPSAPLSVTGTQGNGKVSLTWQAPSSTGGAPITGYGVDYQTGGGAWITAIAPSAAMTARSYTVTGLANGTAYVFRVVAANAIGAGPFSATSPTYTPAATKPGLPTGLTGGSATATSITLNWTAPANDGGAPIIRYVLRLSTDGGLTWATPWLYTPLTNPTGTTLTWAGLTPGTSYQFQVVAANSVGYGAFSPSSAAVSTTP